MSADTWPPFSLILFINQQDEYEELLRYAVVTPKLDMLSVQMKQQRASRLSAAGGSKDDTKSQHLPGIVSSCCMGNAVIHTIHHDWLTEIEHEPFQTLSTSNNWPSERIWHQNMEKTCHVCLSALYFHLVSQASYRFVILYPYRFPLQYPHLKHSISFFPCCVSHLRFSTLTVMEQCTRM